ncbi:MAG TPA: hypothetical protein VFM74_05020 [Candidatus Limnocylindria bacterium]|nr:hypothetical protein [Candidatus Limnocylindria bacterium]
MSVLGALVMLLGIVATIASSLGFRLAPPGANLDSLTVTVRANTGRLNLLEESTVNVSKFLCFSDYLSASKANIPCDRIAPESRPLTMMPAPHRRRSTP